MSVKDALDAFGKRLVQQSKSNLTKSGRKDTGGLYNSLGYTLEVHKNSFHFSMQMEDYGPFVDQGVKGVSSSKRAPNSPFKFGTGTGKKGGLTSAMEAWVQRRRIQFKERKTGRFMTYEQTAFLMTRSIYQKGLEATQFYSKPFANEFAKLPNDVVQQYGLEFNTFLKQAFKQ